MKIIPIKHGIIHEIESKAKCPHCTRLIEMHEAWDKYTKSNNPTIRHKCKGCKRFIGITQGINGDMIAFELIKTKKPYYKT